MTRVKTKILEEGIDVPRLQGQNCTKRGLPVNLQPRVEIGHEILATSTDFRHVSAIFQTNGDAQSLEALWLTKAVRLWGPLVRVAKGGVEFL